MNNSSTTTRTAEDTVKEFCRAFTTQDQDAFFALLAPEFVVSGHMGTQGVNKEIYWKVIVAFHKTFPDIKWELGKWLLSNSDTVVCEIMETGTFTGPWANPTQKIAPTNRSYICDAVVFFRLTASGLIAECRSWYDSVDWYHQIGVDPNVAAPPPAQ